MEWTDPWFIAYIHDDARDKEYMTTWRHPTLMLRDLIADDLLCYPTTLCVDFNSYGRFDFNRPFFVDSSDDDGVQEDPYSEAARAFTSCPQNIKSLVRACPYLDSKDDIASCILDKCEVGATLGFLLTLLPNLTTLKILDNSNYVSHGLLNLRSIIKNVLKIGYSPTASSRRVSPPLSKLKSLELQRDTINIYAPLFQLPSISSIRADDVYSGNVEKMKFPGFHIKAKKSLSRPASSDFKVRKYRIFPEDTC